MRVPYFL